MVTQARLSGPLGGGRRGVRLPQPADRARRVPGDGVVVESGPATGFGLWVVLRHPDGTTSVYGHIKRTFVRVGERVSAGEQIAEVGNRGHPTGPQPFH